MKLTKAQLFALRDASRHIGLLWGGVYERGGDDDICILTERGLIERVATPYWAGNALFPGGFKITNAGRAALSQMEKNDG